MTELPAELVMGEDGSSLTLSIYEALRHEILSAELMPDMRLQTRSLSARFRVGLSPVREALSMLAKDDLVVRRDRRGFIVAPINERDLDDLTKARCWVNEIGLRQSFANGGAEWKERVVIALHRLVETPRAVGGAGDGRNPDWELAHAHFHHSLIGGCGSEWLTKAAGHMFYAAERYRQIARRAGATRPPDREHQAIARSIIKGDVERAVALLNEHMRRTSEMVRVVLNSRTDLATPPARGSARLSTRSGHASAAPNSATRPIVARERQMRKGS